MYFKNLEEKLARGEKPCVVVKAGTKTVTKPRSSKNPEVIFNRPMNITLTNMVKLFHRRGTNCVMVWSGAIALGKQFVTGYDEKDPIMQATASSLGQPILIERLRRLLVCEHIVGAGQILVERSDFLHNAQNLRRVIHALFRSNCVPIINENDPVWLEEILNMQANRDNDLIALNMALILQADLLVICTNVDGYLDNKGWLVEQLTPATISDAIDNCNDHNISNGGMGSKLECAKSAMEQGIPVFIGNPKNIAWGFTLAHGYTPFGTLCLP